LIEDVRGRDDSNPAQPLPPPVRVALEQRAAGAQRQPATAVLAETGVRSDRTLSAWAMAASAEDHQGGAVEIERVHGGDCT
jgi:hypothetical protein